MTTPENPAEARKRETPERIWRITENGTLREWAEPGTHLYPSEQYVEYVRADLLQQPASERCAKCGHRATVNGVCQVGVDGPLDSHGYKPICNCRCVYPATGAPTREFTIEDAAKAVYRKYGANLAAFWRDAFAAEAQRHGRTEVEQYGVDGNCIHCIPICRECQLNTIEAHLREKEQITAATGAGEGERLCGHCKKPITVGACAECWDGVVENLQTQVAEIGRLRTDLSTARANAIREAARELRRRADHAESTGNHLPGTDQAMCLHAEMRALAQAAGALQSLLDKREGEDGATGHDLA